MAFVGKRREIRGCAAVCLQSRVVQDQGLRRSCSIGQSLT